MEDAPTVHGSVVLVGARAILIRGPAGSGKSRLALGLIRAAQAGHLRMARLVADDRVQLEARHGRVLARPAPALAGLIEAHGVGIRRLPYEPVAVVGWVVDLATLDAQRLPEADRRETLIEGVTLPRLPVAVGENSLDMVLNWLGTDAASA
ncbi:MAG TPA: serine kinase [Xanthobacteraceae bacterium]|jgi:serine kinase of HPr protein (carbohydrate metabolism regulator)